MDIIIKDATLSDPLGLSILATQSKLLNSRQKWAMNNRAKLAAKNRAYYHRRQEVNPEAAERKKLYMKERYQRLKALKESTAMI